MALDSCGPVDADEVDGGVPLRSLLMATTAEIDALSEASLRLQPLIAQAVAANSSEQSIEDAQLIDHLVQHLCALSGFITHLASATPADVRVDLEAAVTGLNLSDLKHRLLGGRRILEPEPAGELDLFA